MGSRVQVILDEAERESFRRQAEHEGKSLSAWLRDAGRRRLAEAGEPEIGTVDDLRRFFSALPDRECDEPEPDWEQHREVIDSSRARGRPTA